MKAQLMQGKATSSKPGAPSPARAASSQSGSKTKSAGPEKNKKSLIAKLGMQYKAFELNRYKHYDTALQSLLQYIGPRRALTMHEGALGRFVPGLKWLTGVALLRNKAISENATSELVNYFSKTNSRYIQYSLADWLLKHRAYDSATEAYFEKANFKCREINVNFRYTDFITQKYGFRSEKIEKSIKRMLMPDVFLCLTKNQKLRLAAMLYQRKRDGVATQLIRNVGKGYILKNTTSPYIFNKIVSNAIWKDEYFNRGSVCFKEIVRARNKFESMLVSSRYSFCLVGNAPTEIGSGNGKIIDSKELVIRINNYSLDFPEDYGSKEDVWVRVANNEVEPFRARKNKLTILAGNNFATKRKDAANYLLPLMLMRTDYTIIPSHVFQELIGKLDGLPSTGLALAYWIYKTIGPIPKDFLFGFSHLHEGANFKAHYFVDDEKAGVHLHQWDKEKRIFNQITR
ncbi:glycosyltransferase family 29 protein [Pseudomonas kurunegalensis]|uniref:glycosyltransferase family 29 protein n=1 Tax=Pseudomonas kurunegalensis TaxID=485880 RepID=UPI002570A694|nr:glycosyltransferase family 29 protein [Pseudomonas kurunegalensis]WJD64066.1 glycosyltransferase family 29 protein [Pseudomonas kurunegalensis]